MANEYEDVASTIERLDAENKRLRSALRGMLTMHDKVAKKVNWGASFLDAEAIRLMNDAPIAARAALGEE